MATRFEPSQETRAFVERPATLRPIVPEVVMVPPVNPLFVAMDVTVPEPPLPPTQVPLTAKHPVSTFIPEPNVDVAVVEMFT